MNQIFEEGYCAGLVNERENPHSLMWFAQRALWHAGNQIGLAIHCAVVEAVYLQHEVV